MAGRRRSKVILEDVDGLMSSSADDTSNNNSNTARQRTLSISHSGRFKEQKHRGVLSESVFSRTDDGKKASPTAAEDGEDEANAKYPKFDDVGRVDANIKYPAPAQKEQGVSEKMTVVFETKL